MKTQTPEKIDRIPLRKRIYNLVQRLATQAASLIEQNWPSLGHLIVQALDDNHPRSPNIG